MNVMELIILIGVIQGFFLSLGLLVKNFGKPKQNYYFHCLIGIISIALLAKLLFSVERFLAFPHLWFYIDTAAYVVGPLWYFTILKSIQPKVIIKWKDLLCLAPILYQVFFLIYIMTLPKTELIEYIRQDNSDVVFYIFCFSVLLVNGFFMLRANRLLKKHRDAQFPDLIVKGQYAFLAIMAIWLASFIVSFWLTRAYNINLNMYNYAFISMSFLTFGMAFLALTKPASFYFLTQTYDTGETYILQQIAERITTFLKEEEPFLSKNYALQDLSLKIEANPVLTSKAINRILKTNFNDLINEHRIQHFLKRSREEGSQNLTLWAIAQEAGFGNKATFYKSFKKMMGTTPKAYLSSLPQ